MTSPAHKLRIGTLQATIWRNSGGNNTWYSVQLARGYKVEEAWRETDNLGFDDLLAAAKLLDKAHDWIGHQLDADRKGRKQAEQAAK
ncbi:hypothetical protein [Fimbriiglobus ruber]|uniref:Uncharacterized protein n=1 Tax=Fimbriiglobus ruber TaxID=1908690 RepID=A0A225DX50_9BACT|nr:hypothetical protein [Fimbriiglobus ruber]OWK45573.1 hypothetical protein FRUB_01904 [Fimbriiglobus ruber]